MIAKLPWLQVRESFGQQPVIAQHIESDLNIYVERYLCEPLDSSVPPQKNTVLVTQFDGSWVREGVKNTDKNMIFFPSASAVIPINCSTRWNFSGFTDFAVFYFPHKPGNPFCQFIEAICQQQSHPIVTSNPLIATTAKQVTQELFHNANNTDFICRLMLVMLEQTCKVLSGDDVAELNPKHGQLGRIQTVISHIQNNLGRSLSIKTLAELVELSPTHFRRLFIQATGLSTHQFITRLRLRRSRELLINTNMPIIQIAGGLGFSSQSHFTTNFKKIYSVTPARYRKVFLAEE